jgi:hypothetical protein
MPGSDWRTMATAPRDGKPFLACGGLVMDDGATFADWTPIPAWVGIVAYRPEWALEWRGENTGGHDQWLWHKPAGWMPLPASLEAPEPDDQSGSEATDAAKVVGDSSREGPEPPSPQTQEGSAQAVTEERKEAIISRLVAALEGVRACTDPSQSVRVTTEPAVAAANADWVAYEALRDFYEARANVAAAPTLSGGAGADETHSAAQVVGKVPGRETK